MFNFTMFKFAFSSLVRPFTRKYPHGIFQLEFKETTINISVSEASGNKSLRHQCHSQQTRNTSLPYHPTRHACV